jgi:hypothetical protein
VIPGTRSKSEFSNLCRMRAEPITNAHHRPAEQTVCLQRHQSMRNFPDHLTGNVTHQLLVLDPLEKLRTGRSPKRVWLEMIREGVGIDEYGVSRRQVGEGHGSSGGGG